MTSAQDSVSMIYAPHLGIDENVPVAFWHVMVATRSRSVDNLVVPVIDLLIASCGILLINPPDTATHVVGAALDLMLVSSHCSCTKLGCCPIMGSDHFLCVASA